MKNILDLLTLKEKENIIYKELKVGDILFYEGDVCDSIGIIKSGYIVILSYTFTGGEIIYNTLESGDIFGNNLIFTDDNKYRGNVIAKENSEVVIIKKNVLLDILKNNEEFLKEYLIIQSNFTRSLNTKLKLLAFDSARDRLYFYMSLNDNKITYKTISELSNRLFMKRETLSRLLSKLEKSGEIIRNNNTIIYKNK